MLKSDNTPDCVQCAIADAVNKWRESPHIIAQVEARRRPPFDATAERVMRVSIIRAMALSLVQLVEEESDLYVREVLALDFAEAVESSRTLVRLRRERDAKGSR